MTHIQPDRERDGHRLSWLLQRAIKTVPSPESPVPLCGLSPTALRCKTGLSEAAVRVLAWRDHNAEVNRGRMCILKPSLLQIWTRFIFAMQTSLFLRPLDTDTQLTTHTHTRSSLSAPDGLCGHSSRGTPLAVMRPSVSAAASQHKSPRQHSVSRRRCTPRRAWRERENPPVDRKSTGNHGDSSTPRPSFPSKATVLRVKH